MTPLKLVTFLSVLVLVPATDSFAADDNPSGMLSPNNPNRSPGVQGYPQNYMTTDHSDDVPQRPATTLPAH